MEESLEIEEFEMDWDDFVNWWMEQQESKSEEEQKEELKRLEKNADWILKNVK